MLNSLFASARDVKKHFMERSLRQNAHYILSLKGDSHWLSLSFAIGIFIGVTPFYGAHTIAALAAVSLLRCNLVTTMIGTWLTVPPSLPFIYYLGYRLGRFILQDPVCIPKQALFASIEKIMHFNVAGLGLESQDVIQIAQQLLLGCTIMGLVGSITGYFLLRWAIDCHRAKAAQRKARTQ